MQKSFVDYEIEELVLAGILEKRAAEQPSTTLVKFREGDLSYGEVDDMANRMARGFSAHGVEQGDHVAVMLPNCPDFIYVTIALAKLGAVMVPVNTSYRGEILAHVLDSSDVTAAIVDESFSEVVAAVEAQVPDLGSIIIRTEGPTGNPLRGFDKPTTRLDRMLGVPGETPRARVTHGDLQAIMYTSGTTGPSKGAMIPHALALTDSLDFIRFMDFRPDETTYCPLPLFHAAGLWDGFMAAILAGASIAVVERFSASRFWDDVRHFDANVCMSVFSMIPILQNQPPAANEKDHPLRIFYMGKSDLDADFHERFGVHTPETYTSTEVGIGTASPYGQWRSGSCGQVNSLRHEVRIVDELDREVPAGVRGEIVVRPRQPFTIFSGYYNNPRATMESFRNLWFHTGDRAYRDEEGYFYFVERIKDTIRRRGENISAFEVERAINGHPAVLESAAYAVPSELEEDELKVAVVLHRGEELQLREFIRHCRERMPGFMVPRFLEFVDELPRTPTGKIEKHQLRSRGGNGITKRTHDLERSAKGGRSA
jgi:crotonobetaine/carnitine-CoA ligase